jgi:hypothetical protein
MTFSNWFQGCKITNKHILENKFKIKNLFTLYGSPQTFCSEKSSFYKDKTEFK